MAINYDPGGVPTQDDGEHALALAQGCFPILVTLLRPGGDFKLSFYLYVRQTPRLGEEIGHPSGVYRVTRIQHLCSETWPIAFPTAFIEIRAEAIREFDAPGREPAG